VSPLARQCGILNISHPYRSPQPVAAIALLYFTFFTVRYRRNLFSVTEVNGLKLIRERSLFVPITHETLPQVHRVGKLYKLHYNALQRAHEDFSHWMCVDKKNDMATAMQSSTVGTDPDMANIPNLVSNELKTHTARQNFHELLKWVCWRPSYWIPRRSSSEERVTQRRDSFVLETRENVALLLNMERSLMYTTLCISRSEHFILNKWLQEVHMEYYICSKHRNTVTSALITFSFRSVKKLVHAIKTYWGVDVYISCFLTSTLVGALSSASRPGRFTPRERAPDTN
jgi:hypothetical protein